MPENNTVKVVIADNQFLIVESLRSLIEADDRYELAGIASNREELFQLLEKVSHGLLIIDFSNMDFDSIAELHLLKLKFQQISLLVLTNTITKSEFTELSRIAIKNIIYKTVNKEELFEAIDYTLKRKKYYSDEILELFLDSHENKIFTDENKQLTISEMEIVKLIVNGMTTKEIAIRRNISYHTVNTHRKNIFRKLEVCNATELIIHAIKAGWIDNIEYYI